MVFIRLCRHPRALSQNTHGMPAQSFGGNRRFEPQSIPAMRDLTSYRVCRAKRAGHFRCNSKAISSGGSGPQTWFWPSFRVPWEMFSQGTELPASVANAQPAQFVCCPPNIFAMVVGKPMEFDLVCVIIKTDRVAGSGRKDRVDSRPKHEQTRTEMLRPCGSFGDIEHRCHLLAPLPRFLLAPRLPCRHLGHIGTFPQFGERTSPFFGVHGDVSR